MNDELALIQSDDLLVFHQQPIDQHPAAVYLAGLSPSGRYTQRQALNTLAGLLTDNADASACNWAAVRFQHTQAIRSKLTEIYKPATVNKMLCALRGVLKNAWLLEQMTAEDYHKAASVRSVREQSLPAGRELSPGEIAGLMQTCENDPTPAGVRDAAMIALLYTGGLRREEIVNLSLASCADGQVIVRGKRNKERAVYLVNGAARALSDWLKLRGSDDDPLFCAINKGGKLDTGQPLSPQAVYDLLKKRGTQAGVADFSPHDLRRTFVSDLLDAGADIATVSKMAGHANIQTTARYDRRPEEAKRKAAGLLHVPYRGRAV